MLFFFFSSHSSGEPAIDPSLDLIDVLIDYWTWVWSVQLWAVVLLDFFFRRVIKNKPDFHKKFMNSWSSSFSCAILNNSSDTDIIVHFIKEKVVNAYLLEVTRWYHIHNYAHMICIFIESLCSFAYLCVIRRRYIFWRLNTRWWDEAGLLLPPRHWLFANKSTIKSVLFL